MIYKKISTVVCTYNGEKYIEEQLRSILEQTVRTDEIVICDDNSNDKTVDIVKRVMDNSSVEYKIIVNEKNVGVTKNFENAVKCATGDIIFFSDQDDIWMKNKIEELIEVFDNQDCVVAYSNSEILEGDKINKNSLWEIVGFNPLLGINYSQELLRKSLITGATMVARKSYLEKIMPFPKVWIHDGWIVINAQFYGEMCYVNKKLMKYRIHGANVVGVSSGFNSKIKNYISNIKTLEKERVSRYKRYKIFYKRNKYKFKNIHKKELEKCINFWEDMIRLRKDKLIGIKLVLKNLINGNYNKFYTGFRGAIRDIISIFVI